MSEQNKSKNHPIGQIRYYWNLALAARKFEAEVNAPPEAIADLFSDIEQSPQGVLIPNSRSANIKTIKASETYDFDLRIKHTNKNMHYTSVKATGSIIYSEGYNQTIVRGDIRIGWVYTLSMLAGILSLVVGILIMPEAFPMLGFVLLFSGFVFWNIRRDYRYLTTFIHDQINQAQRAQIDHADGSDDVDFHMLSDDESSEFTSER